MTVEVGNKIKVTQYTSKLQGQEGTIKRIGELFDRVQGCKVPTYTIYLKSGEKLLLLDKEFEVIE